MKIEIQNNSEDLKEIKSEQTLDGKAVTAKVEILEKKTEEKNHLKVNKIQSKSLEKAQTGEKLFKCESCSRSFQNIHFYRRHQLTHTGEKPYGCETCGKHFPRKDNLRLHERSHTNERPYKCGVCGSCFRQLNHLKIHATNRQKS